MISLVFLLYEKNSSFGIETPNIRLEQGARQQAFLYPLVKIHNYNFVSIVMSHESNVLREKSFAFS